MSTTNVHDGLKAHVVVRHGSFALDVALDLPPGEVLGVIGPNGAGKTTLMRALAGLVPLDAGTVSLGGTVLTTGHDAVPPHRRRVGMVFQDHRLFDHLSVRDNIAFGPRRHGMRRREARRVADELMRRVGIEELGGRRPSAISGGQAQRVALARALAVDPDLVLMDEPLSAVDVAARAVLRSELRTLLRGGPPAVLVTHDLRDALEIADRLVVIEGGRVTHQGHPAEHARSPRTPYVAQLLGDGADPTAAPPDPSVCGRDPS